MKGTPMDINKLVDFIRANGPVTAEQAMRGAGYTSGKDVSKKLHAYATAFGQIEAIDKKWQRVAHRKSSQYIPQFKPLKGLDLWAGAMRPGAMDYRNIPSRVA